MEKTNEAPLRLATGGLVPHGDGWFIVNAAEAQGSLSPTFGGAVRFEGFRDDAHPFPEFAVNIRLLRPGQPNGYYHRENVDECFLVLRGECLAIVEEQERPLRRGDFLYAPAGTAHIFVGAGDGPCAILMFSKRVPEEDEIIEYPVSEVATRHNASVKQRTDSPAEAYAGAGKPEPAALGELF